MSYLWICTDDKLRSTTTRPVLLLFSLWSFRDFCIVNGRTHPVTFIRLVILHSARRTTLHRQHLKCTKRGFITRSVCLSKKKTLLEVCPNAETLYQCNSSRCNHNTQISATVHCKTDPQSWSTRSKHVGLMKDGILWDCRLEALRAWWHYPRNRVKLRSVVVKSACRTVSGRRNYRMNNRRSSSKSPVVMNAPAPGRDVFRCHAWVANCVYLFHFQFTAPKTLHVPYIRCNKRWKKNMIKNGKIRFFLINKKVNKR